MEMTLPLVGDEERVLALEEWRDVEPRPASSLSRRTRRRLNAGSELTR